jgi:hypothetical protein
MHASLLFLRNALLALYVVLPPKVFSSSGAADSSTSMIFLGRPGPVFFHSTAGTSFPAKYKPISEQLLTGGCITLVLAIVLAKCWLMTILIQREVLMTHNGTCC